MAKSSNIKTTKSSTQHRKLKENKSTWENPNRVVRRPFMRGMRSTALQCFGNLALWNSISIIQLKRQSRKVCFNRICVSFTSSSSSLPLHRLIFFTCCYFHTTVVILWPWISHLSTPRINWLFTESHSVPEQVTSFTLHATSSHPLGKLKNFEWKITFDFCRQLTRICHFHRAPLVFDYFVQCDAFCGIWFEYFA